jgi:hypothetical protein
MIYQYICKKKSEKEWLVIEIHPMDSPESVEKNPYVIAVCEHETRANKIKSCMEFQQRMKELESEVNSRLNAMKHEMEWFKKL